MHLTPLETDLLGDMAEDDHGLWEVFEFVRLHHPNAADGEVFKIGRDLLATWIDRGWLRLAGEVPKWGLAQAMTDVLPIVDKHGIEATRHFDGAPWLDLAPRAYADVKWLRRAV